MGLVGVHGLADAMDGGGTWSSFIYKSNGPLNFGARWGDASMGPGTPKYNAYVGNQFEATTLTGAGNAGIYVGPTPPAGQSKYLTRMLMQTPQATLAPSKWLLCDYLMFYPLVDGDDTAEQPLVNDVTLPRYATGNGVMCFIVQTTPTGANSSITLSYTNSAGVSGRSTTVALATATPSGAILNSSNASALAAGSMAPFVPLAGGDLGIRSIQSATMGSSAGGFLALVLVKPLASITVREQNTAAEINTWMHRASCPVILDGAYLNLVFLTGVNTTTFSLYGQLDFTNG